MMFMTDRFMASAMSLVRIAPEAPTSAPAMIRTGLSMTKPAIATAVPVNEFSRLITTGMSAPPIGSVIVTPKMSAASRMTAMTGTRGCRSTGTARRGRRQCRARGHDRHRRSEDGRRGGVIGFPDEPLQLAGRDERAGERDAADDDVEDRRDV